MTPGSSSLGSLVIILLVIECEVLVIRVGVVING